MDNKIGLTFIHKNRLLFFTNSAALRGGWVQAACDRGNLLSRGCTGTFLLAY